MVRLLFIDDDPGAQKTLKMVLAENYEVTSALTGNEGLALAEELEPEVVLLDINLPDLDGLDLLERLVRSPLSPAVIMLTAYGEVQFIKRAIQAGAYDYIVKPFELKNLEGTIRHALQNRHGRRPPLSGPVPEAFAALVGDSRVMRELKQELLRYGPADSPVLVQGESGTGKELAARALHQLSSRHEAPFVAINCAALPESLLETELFGAERGAYTDAVSRPGCFEQANGGTIFLDEIGEMAPSAQAKLLRVLEAKELFRVGGREAVVINIRVVSATNRNLRERMAESRFREDLYYRISVLPVAVPSLRARPEDIPLLAYHFLRLLGRDSQRLAEGALSRLAAHSWPGNVRELRNVIERAALLAGEQEIKERDILFT